MTEQQLTLDGNTAPPRLGPRQRFVLDLLQARGPMYSDEVGAEIHLDLGKHGLDTRCPWCGSDGTEVLRALEAHRLVTKTGSQWQTGQPESAQDVYDPRTAPWPERF